MNMPTIVPAIIPQSFEHLRSAVKSVADVVSAVQIDIVDGIFAPFISWPYTPGGSATLGTFKSAGGFPSIAPLVYELDLMVNEPELSIGEWLACGAQRFVIHVESTTHLSDIIVYVREAGREVGVAVGNDTPLSVLESYIPSIDFVQCMGIAQIGQQGQPFDERVLERINTLHTTHPELPISIDGSVNAETIVRLRNVGATRFVSGSAIFGESDLARAYRELAALVNA